MTRTATITLYCGEDDAIDSQVMMALSITPKPEEHCERSAVVGVAYLLFDKAQDLFGKARTGAATQVVQ